MRETTDPADPLALDSDFVAWACLPLRPVSPGAVVDDTLERRFELQPSWRVAGPNRVTRIRCSPSRVSALVAEVREMAARHDVQILWTLDRDARPADLAERLLALGLVPSPRDPDGSLVMVRDASTPVGDIPAGVTFADGLASPADYQLTTQVQDAAFAGLVDLPQPGDLTRRYREALGSPEYHLVRADAHGEPAGAGRVVVDPRGALLGGGAVRPQFRGHGIYTALVEQRRRIAVTAGARGLAVHGGRMSAPILAHLGFAVVGKLQDFLDPTLL